MEIHSVFIASSLEMKHERMELVDLIEDLPDCRAVVWESMDKAMRAYRKEDEYLERLRKCEVCITMFWQTLGQYTKEEVLAALAEQQAGRLPHHNYVMLKDIGTPSSELAEFVSRLHLSHPSIIHTFTTVAELRSIVEGLLKAI